MWFFRDPYKKLIKYLKEKNSDISARALQCRGETITILFIKQLTDRESLSNFVIRPILEYLRGIQKAPASGRNDGFRHLCRRLRNGEGPGQDRALRAGGQSRPSILQRQELGKHAEGGASPGQRTDVPVYGPRAEKLLCRRFGYKPFPAAVPAER